MAKQIIILNNSTGPGGDQNVSALFWYAVGTGKQIPTPGFTSAWRGASNVEQASLQAGSTVEVPFSAQYPVGFNTAQIEAALQTSYNNANTIFQARPNPNNFYGAFFDGTIWQAAAPLPPGNTSNGLQFGSVIISGTGDNTVITGTAGQAISIVQLQVAAAGAVTVLIKDGVTTKGGYVFPAGGGAPVVLPATLYPWFVTSAGNNFIINLSAAVNTIFSGWYRQA